MHCNKKEKNCCMNMYSVPMLPVMPTMNYHCCHWKNENIGVGKDGKSAYEIAVDNGFVGTEQEWLSSLISHPKPAIAFWTNLKSAVSFPANVSVDIPLNIVQGVGIVEDDAYYIVPEKGWWYFTARFGLNDALTNSQNFYMIINDNMNTNYAQVRSAGMEGTALNRHTIGGLYYCEKGDKIRVQVTVSVAATSPSSWIGSNRIPILSGFFIGI